MPQIAQLAQVYASQIFWMLVVFGLIYFGIAKGMLPKVEATIDGRDRRISDDLAAARTARATADATEEAYRTRMMDARAAAQKAAADVKAAAAMEAEAKVKAADAAAAGQVAQAEERLKAQQVKASATIEEVAIEAAQDIVQRLTGMTVPRDRASAAVRVALES